MGHGNSYEKFSLPRTSDEKDFHEGKCIVRDKGRPKIHKNLFGYLKNNVVCVNKLHSSM
jgi:hypothetical protein